MGTVDYSNIECSPEFYSLDHIKQTRKPHRCYESGIQIAAGSEAYCVSGKWEGVVASYYFLPEVWRLRQQVEESTGEALAFGELKEFMDNCEVFDPQNQYYQYWLLILESYNNGNA